MYLKEEAFTNQWSSEESSAREAGGGGVQTVAELKNDHDDIKMVDDDDGSYLGGSVTTHRTFATHAPSPRSCLDMFLNIAT